MATPAMPAPGGMGAPAPAPAPTGPRQSASNDGGSGVDRTSIGNHGGTSEASAFERPVGTRDLNDAAASGSDADGNGISDPAQTGRMDTGEMDTGEPSPDGSGDEGAPPSDAPSGKPS